MQEFIRSIERAVTPGAEDRPWLRQLCHPEDACFRSLVSLLLEPKYKGFVGLQCVTLRAVQLVVRISGIWFERDNDASIGMQIFRHLLGDEVACKASSEMQKMAFGQERHVVCNALLALAELGPEALRPKHTRVLLESIADLPERADDLAEVALRAHTFGGENRSRLLEETVAHTGGQQLIEVLLQVLNRAEPERRLRAVKILADCLILPGSENLLYTNDVRVLVEILLRELPYQASKEAAFVCYAKCYQALIRRYAAARDHRRDEALQVLQDLHGFARDHPRVQEKCAEIVAVLRSG